VTENEKFEKIVKLIIELNPDVPTAKELIKVLDYHSTMKSAIRDSWDYAAGSVN